VHAYEEELVITKLGEIIEGGLRKIELE